MRTVDEVLNWAKEHFRHYRDDDEGSEDLLEDRAVAQRIIENARLRETFERLASPTKGMSTNGGMERLPRHWVGVFRDALAWVSRLDGHTHETVAVADQLTRPGRGCEVSWTRADPSYGDHVCELGLKLIGCHHAHCRRVPPSKEPQPCRHPQASRMPLGDTARWCAKCGSVSESEAGNLARWGRWRKPQGGVK